MDPRCAGKGRTIRRRRTAILISAVLLVTGCHAARPRITLPPAVSDPAVQARVLPVVPETAPPAASDPADPLPSPADGPFLVSLDEAIGFALQNNPRLREAAARVEAAQAGVEIAFAPFLPEAGAHLRASDFSVPVLPAANFVPASLNGGVTSFSFAEAGVQWTLYDFGRTGGRYGQAVSQASIEKLGLQRARQTIAFEVSRAYFQVLFAQANRRVREQAVRLAESVLKDTKARRAAGVADPEMVLRAEVEVSTAREELVGARQLVLDAVSTLNLALGRPAALPVQVRDVTSRPTFAQSLEEALQQAVTKRPEVDMGRQAVAGAAYGEKVARGNLLPKIYVRGTVLGITSNGPLNGWLSGAGLHVDQPLYDGGRYRAEIRRQRAQVAGAIAALQTMLDNIGQQVNLAYQAIATQQERIRLGETTVTQSSENLRLTLVKYNNGNATPTDVVDAQTALTRAQTRYFSAVYEYLEGLARLEYAQGGNQSNLVGQLRQEPAEKSQEETLPEPRTAPSEPRPE
ncbi:MAG TPA: TolC family protein [Gemmataceae bacterium]|nr:TolC family protein [Gemmataceae bacterium]